MKITLTDLKGEAKVIEGLLAVTIASHPVSSACVAFVLGLIIGHLL